MSRINTMRNLDSLTFRQIRFLFTGCNCGIFRPEGNRLYDFYLKHEKQVVDLFLEDPQNHGRRPFYFWFGKNMLSASEEAKEDYLFEHQLFKEFE